MPTGFEQDPHSENGHACPRNRFGITDYLELQELETLYVVKRQEEIVLCEAIGKFDVAHLRAIHKYLFQDVFPWAGEFRQVNISKGNSSFGPARFLEGALTDVFGKLGQEGCLRGLEVRKFAERAAFYLGEINAIHPFREGNGRTQRELIRQLAQDAGHSISWAGFTQEEMVNASIASHTKGDNAGLASILQRALRKGVA